MRKSAPLVPVVVMAAELSGILNALSEKINLIYARHHRLGLEATTTITTKALNLMKEEATQLENQWNMLLPIDAVSQQSRIIYRLA